MTIQIAEIDVNLNLPVDVRAKIATNLGDPATVEGAAVATSIGGGILRGADGKNYRIISGPLRNDGAGWFAIDDAGHSPVGIDSVSVNGSGHLVVNYASLGANFVVFASCWPDETLALNGFTAGASVGVAETTLKIYQDTPAQAAYIYYDTGTATWKRSTPSTISSTFAHSTSTGKLVVNHNTVPSGAPADIQAVARAGPYSVKVGSSSPSSTELYFYDAAGAVVTGTPTADHQVYFHRGGGMQLLVDASTIDTVAYPSGNFWFYAVMEVP
jgi:hypothetical protein